MRKSREIVNKSLNHENTTLIPVDFGATAVTGLHCKVIQKLRDYYKLEHKPVKIVDSFQMLGEVDDELAELLGVDCVGIGASHDVFGMDVTRLHEQLTPWGQSVLVPEQLNLTPAKDGNVYVFAEGDRSFAPSAMMPEGGYFFDALERQKTIDESNLNYKDNLEEYKDITDQELVYYSNVVTKACLTGRSVVASFGGAALGDVAFVPGMGLKEPKGIRSVVEWYMSTVMRQDYIHQIFDSQVQLAIKNYEKIWNTVGDKVDVVFICGTDFGTQDSQFCSVESFTDLWLPHYKKLNDWIHENTTWKTFKHSCGAIVPLLPSIIEAGFDIINPVQINAKDMDSKFLKKEYGKYLTFWGGGVDTQKILPYASPDEIRRHVINQCEIFGKDGGFIFNAVHNIQANVPIENVVAIFDALKDINGRYNS